VQGVPRANQSDPSLQAAEQSVPRPDQSNPGAQSRVG